MRLDVSLWVDRFACILGLHESASSDVQRRKEKGDWKEITERTGVSAEFWEQSRVRSCLCWYLGWKNTDCANRSVVKLTCMMWKISFPSGQNFTALFSALLNCKNYYMMRKMRIPPHLKTRTDTATSAGTSRHIPVRPSEHLNKMFKVQGVSTYHKTYNTLICLLVHAKDRRKTRQLQEPLHQWSKDPGQQSEWKDQGGHPYPTLDNLWTETGVNLYKHLINGLDHTVMWL